MHHTTNRRRRLAVAGLTLVLAAGTAACGDDGGSAAAADAPTDVAALRADVIAALTEPAASTQYVGTVDGTDAYIGLTDDGSGQLAVYVCDGEQLGAWLGGPLDDGAFDVTDAADDGVRVEGRIDGDSVSGTVHLPDGSAHAFTAERASAPAGVYQLSNVEDGQPVYATTIQLPDGTSRGLLNRPGSRRWCGNLKGSIQRMIETGQQPGFQNDDEYWNGVFNTNAQYVSNGCEDKTGSAFS